MIDESYYLALAVMDRVIDEARKLKNMKKTARDAGLNGLYLHQLNYLCSSPSLENVVKLAAAMDVSVEYLLTGKGRGNFSPVILSCERILRVKAASGNCFSRSLLTIKSRLKSGAQKNICVKTAFDFERVSGIPVMKLFFKEKTEEECQA